MDRHPSTSFVVHAALAALRFCATVLFFVFPIVSGAQAASPGRALKLCVADVAYAAPVLVAEVNGYLAHQGLTVEVQHLKWGSACLRKLIVGEVDFATAADVAVLMPLINRKEFDILATLTTASYENHLVIRQSPGVKGPSDLRGRRIGVEAGTGVHYFVTNYLLFHGINQSDVTFVPVDIKNPNLALQRGEVDAVGVLSPQVPGALKSLQGQGIVSKYLPVYTLTFNLMSKTVGGQVSDGDALKLLRALRRAEQFIKAEPVKARAIVASVLKVPTADLAKNWDELDFRLGLKQVLISNLESQERWARTSQLVEADTPMVPVLDRIRVGPLRQLDARAVRLIR